MHHCTALSQLGSRARVVFSCWHERCVRTHGIPAQQLCANTGLSVLDSKRQAKPIYCFFVGHWQTAMVFCRSHLKHIASSLQHCWQHSSSCQHCEMHGSCEGTAYAAQQQLPRVLHRANMAVVHVIGTPSQELKRNAEPCCRCHCSTPWAKLPFLECANILNFQIMNRALFYCSMQSSNEISLFGNLNIFLIVLEYVTLSTVDYQTWN